MVICLVEEDTGSGGWGLAIVAQGLRSCGSQVLVSGSAVGAGFSCSLSIWNLSGPGTEPMSPELAGRFLSTVPWVSLINLFLKCLSLLPCKRGAKDFCLKHI